ncbi:MAG: ABC-F family ATP-binding cassette domain-containing protein [Alphaproteobacteria bacterium]|nr:ABC-F family ATP-binding cassette domain-containing protein [Alphaproteobacteria bacterium]
MAFEPPVYTLKDIKLRFGTNQLFRGVELYINRGDKISLVGRNGSGKSTLLKIIAGIQEPDDGEIFIQPETTIGYMPQDADLSGYKTLREVVLSGISEQNPALEYKAQMLIEQLAINDKQDPELASGGERRKATLAKALVGEPDILLLDEPTNHLDMPTIEFLEKLIASYSGAVVVISHDRRFLCNTSRTTFWLDRGIMHRNNKGFQYFEEWQDQIIEQEIIAQKHLNKKLAEETEWLHKGVTARRRRNQGRLRRLLQLRQERREQIKQIGSVNMEVENTHWKSKIVIEAKHITKSFENRPIVKDFSTKIIRGNRIGIVGPNGAGKTTLIKLLTKKLEPDAGNVRIGKNLSEAYFDQNRFTLNPQKTLWQTLCEEGDHIWVRGSYRHVVAYLKDFLFTPDQAKSPVAALSGGEKNRLMLAKVLAQPSNFLLLDEPTNDLDMDTLDLLQEMLGDYDGTMIIVSHDRDFLDHLVTSIIYMRGNGNIEEYVGSYSDALEKISPQSVKAKAVSKAKPEAARPKMINSRKLSYNQQRLLEILPSQIEEIERKIKEVTLKLADTELYQKDREQFFALSEELKELENQKSEAENQWLEISIIAEEPV